MPSESSPASISGASADTFGISSSATSRTIAVVCTGTLPDTTIGEGAAACFVGSGASSPMAPVSTCFIVTGACSRLGVEAAARGAAISAPASSLKPYLLFAVPSGVGDPVSSRWYALLDCGPAGLATQPKRPNVPGRGTQMATHSAGPSSLRASSLASSLPPLSNPSAAQALALSASPVISGAIHSLFISRSG